MQADLLYHCFPRRASKTFNVLDFQARNAPEYVQEGIGILDSILEKGFLLAHEDKGVSEIDPLTGSRSKRLWVEQYRFCLTVLPSILLRDHCVRFGAFAIGVDLEDAVAMGAVPVFYLPAFGSSSPAHLRGLKTLSVSLLFRLQEAQLLTEKLARISQQHSEGLGDRCCSLDCLRRLNEDIVSFGEVAGALRFLGSIVYPTQDTEGPRADPLYYYRQHEWRIISGVAESLISEKANTGAKPLYGSATEVVGDKKFRYLRPLNGKSVGTKLRIVVCPEHAISHVNSLVGDFGVRVISFENIDKVEGEPWPSPQTDSSV